MEVVLTFHGARGVDYEDPEDFELMKAQDPNWEPVRDSMYSIADSFRPAAPADYPIDWRHNDEGDLVVVITLQRLRPLSEWRSDDYGEDVVLVVDPGVDLDEVTITYTATAHGYSDVFEGEPMAVPVEKVAMLDVLREVVDATREAS